MTTQRQELAEIIETVSIFREKGETRNWETRKADAILAAGYRKPRTITTVEELDALELGAIILMNNVKAPFLLTDDGWESTRIPGKPVYDYTGDTSYLPATVLYEPTA